jgi:hypothetical protein
MLQSLYEIVFLSYYNDPSLNAFDSVILPTQEGKYIIIVEVLNH